MKVNLCYSVGGPDIEGMLGIEGWAGYRGVSFPSCRQDNVYIPPLNLKPLVGPEVSGLGIQHLRGGRKKQYNFYGQDFIKRIK